MRWVCIQMRSQNICLWQAKEFTAAVFVIFFSKMNDEQIRDLDLCFSNSEYHELRSELVSIGLNVKVYKKMALKEKQQPKIRKPDFPDNWVGKCCKKLEPFFEKKIGKVPGQLSPSTIAHNATYLFYQRLTDGLPAGIAIGDYLDRTYHTLQEEIDHIYSQDQEAVSDEFVKIYDSYHTIDLHQVAQKESILKYAEMMAGQTTLRLPFKQTLKKIGYGEILAAIEAMKMNPTLDRLFICFKPDERELQVVLRALEPITRQNEFSRGYFRESREQGCLQIDRH